jgi:hypothetical protein
MDPGTRFSGGHREIFGIWRAFGQVTYRFSDKLRNWSLVTSQQSIQVTYADFADRTLFGVEVTDPMPNEPPLSVPCRDVM